MKRLLFAAHLFFVLFLFTSLVFAEEQKQGTVKGKLTAKGGEPMAGGLVFFFNAAKGPGPDLDKYWRVPDDVADIKEKGEFSITLMEGTYYMGGIRRASGKGEVGPPVTGDFFLISKDEKGNPRVYTVKKDETIDLGTISEAIPFNGVVTKGKITAVEGRVLSSEGKPVEGALVFAYTLSTMVGKPAFVSDRTGKDGSYLLRVSEGGNYYLKVRDIYGGGPPATGGIMGGYGEEAPIPVAVRKDETTKDVDITVKKFRERGPKKE